MITQAQMKRALIITVVLTCLSGLALVTVASKTTSDFIGFLVLGLLAIIAAITYTVGTRPYGYIGLGDISVLVFFGWLSVMGKLVLTGAHGDPCPVPAGDRLWSAGDGGAEYQ